jgi:two-component system cell cycle response regulator
VTLSIGVVTFDPVPATPEELVRLADKAMYKGKRQGRNRVVSRQYPPPVRAPREI